MNTFRLIECAYPTTHPDDDAPYYIGIVLGPIVVDTDGEYHRLSTRYRARVYPLWSYISYPYQPSAVSDDEDLPF